MKAVQIHRLCEKPQLLEQAVLWFSKQWGIPPEAYRESMQAYLQCPAGIPQWYVLLDEAEEIVAGAGVIENDFHERLDLTPNLCALFIEPAWRGQGLARALLEFARQEMQAIGVEKLYLVTDHTRFYERCGWSFLTMVQDEEGLQRMYTISTARTVEQ